MTELEVKTLPVERTVVAPDGSDVRVLLRRPGGSMAHFQLAAGQVSNPVRHKTVDEIWYVLGGRGEMWRKRDDEEVVVAMEPGVSLTIPVGTSFQFRSFGPEPLAAIGITMPPWPGDLEWEPVDGHPEWTVSTVMRTSGGRQANAEPSSAAP